MPNNPTISADIVSAPSDYVFRPNTTIILEYTTKNWPEVINIAVREQNNGPTVLTNTVSIDPQRNSPAPVTGRYQIALDARFTPGGKYLVTVGATCGQKPCYAYIQITV